MLPRKEKNAPAELRRAGLPQLRVHDLRHVHAALLLGRGVHPRVVADRLGHSEIRLTLDLHSHALPDIQRDAVRAMDEVLPEIGLPAVRRKPR
jgi:integrase